MQERSFMKNTEMQLHTGSINMKTLNKACLFAVAAAFAFTTGTAFAHSSAALKEDQAQLKTDQTALAHEKVLLKDDLKTLKADTEEGKMAAESKDAEQVYQDQRAIKGEKKDIAADKPGSLQMKADKTAIAREEQRMTADVKTLNADTREGRMAAESKDGEKVYKDQQAIKGVQKDVAADEARLKADRKG